MLNILHATAVEYQGIGILLIGASGSGKSDLALRMIQQGAVLIADDQVVAQSLATHIQLSAPERLQGMLEVRGVGIVKLPFQASCQLSVVIQLRPFRDIERLPQQEYHTVGDHRIPLYHIDASQPSAVNRLKVIIQIQTGQCRMLDLNNPDDCGFNR